MGLTPRDRRAARKGRGTSSNPPGRYEVRRTVPLEQTPGEDPPILLEEERSPTRTRVSDDRTRTIIARNDSPDIPFDRSINPYRGCEHGCIYCFARPSHAWLGLSPGLDFETRILAKPDAPARLEKEIGRKGYEPAVIALGSNTDPYQPVERGLGITRQILEVLARYRHPVSIVTKSDLVLRDLDLLSGMAQERLASVMVSVTTLDADLARRMEPRATAPHRRVEALRAIAAAGVPAGVLASPMIPAINDMEIERILEACAGAGARAAGYILLRLPYEVKDLFREWLHEHYPLRAARVLSLLRQCRGGALNDPAYGSRMRGAGAYADLIRSRFDAARRRWGLADTLGALDATRFRVPGSGPVQGTLFADEG